MSYDPRKPTEQERQSLAKSYSEKYGVDPGCHTDNPVWNGYIAVFDGYITGGPGFCGTVAVIVYDGGPEFTETWAKTDATSWKLHASSNEG